MSSVAIYPEPITFRFDARAHEYILDDGTVAPHITGMLKQSGWIDDEWFTEASKERGSAVHRLTADYDLGALTDVRGCSSPYKGWLLAHVRAMEILRPVILHVEEPVVHPTYRFGGRPDRVIELAGLVCVLEGKSGPPAKEHRIQTALQAILISPEVRLPPDVIGRYALYWQENGKFKVEEHVNRRDFDEAWRILRSCCG